MFPESAGPCCRLGVHGTKPRRGLTASRATATGVLPIPSGLVPSCPTPPPLRARGPARTTTPMVPRGVPGRPDSHVMRWRRSHDRAAGQARRRSCRRRRPAWPTSPRRCPGPAATATTTRTGVRAKPPRCSTVLARGRRAVAGRWVPPPGAGGSAPSRAALRRREHGEGWGRGAGSCPRSLTPSPVMFSRARCPGVGGRRSGSLRAPAGWESRTCRAPARGGPGGAMAGARGTREGKTELGLSQCPAGSAAGRLHPHPRCSPRPLLLRHGTVPASGTLR